MIQILLLTLPLVAWAGKCNLSLSDLQDWDFRKDPNPSVTLKVKRQGSANCEYFLTVDNGGAASFTQRSLRHSDFSASLPVQICADAACNSVLKHFPEATNKTDVLSGSFSSGDGREQTLTIRPKLTAGAYDRFGSYSANFVVRLYSGTLTGSSDLEETETFRLSARIDKKIDLSIVSPGSAFDPSATYQTLNFGTLSEGKELYFDLVLKYNAGYQVRLSSQNGGRLRHSQRSDTIPYTLSLGGTSVNLASGSQAPWAGQGVSPEGGRRLDGRVRVGALGSAPAGTYQDAVTITVSTTE